jgi:hypothetical protein
MRLLLSCLAALALCAPTGAQSHSERHPALGLTLKRPRSYDAVPVPPREEYVKLRYVRTADEGARDVDPTLLIAVLPRSAALDDTRRYLEYELRPRAREEQRAGATRFGHRPVRFEYEARDADGHELRGFVHGWEGRERTVIVHGFSAPEDFVEEARVWRRVAETLELATPRGDARARLEWGRYYGQRRLLGVEARIDARLSLVDGWAARDTQHYIVLSHDVDPDLAARIAADLEVLRGEYPRRLGGDEAAYAVGVVRVCKDRDEYLTYGGLANAVGYFSPAEGELVLYDTGDEEQTVWTLYHEALHQYVFHAAGGLAPHPWFDEGNGEYFGSARVVDGRVAAYRAHPIHVQLVQRALADGTAAPLAELFAMSQADYYANGQVHYPQGWSVVHFLREADGGARWRGLLERYYATLERAWRVRRAQLVTDGAAPDWGAARDAVRAEALAAALKGVDLGALEEAWARWARGLALPGPR